MKLSETLDTVGSRHTPPLPSLFLLQVNHRNVAKKDYLADTWDRDIIKVETKLGTHSFNKGWRIFSLSDSSLKSGTVSENQGHLVKVF